MKKLLCVLSCLLLSQSFVFAQAVDVEETEIVHESSAEEESHISIREVKDLARSLPVDSTCLDDYLKRRTQHITNLALTPVYVTAAVAGGSYAGGATAAGVAAVTGVQGWGALGYIIVGGAAGAGLSVAYVAYDTTKSALGMIDNNLMLKVLSEQYLNKEGPKTQKLYQKYLKKAGRDHLSKDEFVAKLMEADANGNLCDGTLVKQPRFKIGFKLKYKVAKSKDFINSLSK